MVSCLVLLACGAAPPHALSAAQQTIVRGNEKMARDATRAWNDGRHAEAIRLLREILAREEKLFGPWHREPLGSLGQLASWHEQHRQWKEAEAVRRRVVEASVGLYGPEAYQVVDARMDLRRSLKLATLSEAKVARILTYPERYGQAAKLYQSGQYAQARARNVALLRDVEECLGKDSPQYATLLNNLGLLHKIENNFDKAKELLEKAREARVKLLGPRHPAVSTTLGNLGLLLHDMGDTRAALPVLQQALEIRKAADGVGHPSYAVCLNNVALILDALGETSRALPMYQEVARLHGAASGEKSFNYAITLLNLGKALTATGRPEEATALLQKASALVPQRHPIKAEFTRALAMSVSAAGDPVRGIGLARAALAQAEKAHSASSLEYAVCLNDLAGLSRMMGDVLMALGYHQQALDIRREKLGPKHPAYASSLNNYGVQLVEVGLPAKGLPLLKEALAVVEARLGKGHPVYAMYLHNVALARHALGEIKEAILLYKEALAVQRRVLGTQSGACLITRYTLAQAHADLGQHRTALHWLAEARAAAPVADGRYPKARATLLRLQARSSLALGKHGAANLCALQAAAETFRTLELTAAGQSERQQLDIAAQLRQHIGLCLALPDVSAETSHGLVLRWKGAVLARQSRLRLLARLRGDPAHRLLAMRLATSTRRLALLSQRPMPNEEWGREVFVKEGLERELARSSAEFRAGQKLMTSREIASSLPVGVVLVDYFSYLPSQIDGKDDSRLAAWVLQRGRPTVRVELGPTATAETAVKKWRLALEKGLPGEAEGRAARARIWGPLEKHLAGASAVLVSPDGPLTRVPFAALPGRKASFLVEEVGVALVPVPQLVPQLLSARGRAGKPGLLALGKVDFDAPLSGSLLPGRKAAWQPLPATDEEVRAVQGLFKGLPGRGTVRLLVGRDASKANLQRHLGSNAYAHLATHGYFARPAALPSRSDDWKRAVIAIARRLHPSLYAGLVLAGANRPTDQDTGMLTALEVAEMDLSGLELAVLSACETGLGEEAGGEGLLGLQRAFQVAGCKSVVSSLWSVHDAATSVLMERLYHHLWKGKKGKLEALRLAQLDVLRQPELVEERQKMLADTPGLRGVGKVTERIVAGGKKERRSPPAWWAAWQLSGGWR
jgi:CHAT domain-containing protein/tetratricopeptide (TPR) repeat protein